MGVVKEKKKRLRNIRYILGYLADRVQKLEKGTQG